MDGKEEELGPPDYATDPVPILPVDPIPPQMLWEDAEHCLEEHACIFCILKEGGKGKPESVVSKEVQKTALVRDVLKKKRYI